MNLPLLTFGGCKSIAEVLGYRGVVGYPSGQRTWARRRAILLLNGERSPERQQVSLKATVRERGATNHIKVEDFVNEGMKWITYPLKASV